MKFTFPPALLLALPLSSCQFFEEEQPDLGRIYKQAADASADTRRPVIVIPGIMGSKLETPEGVKVWGAFTRGAVDPDYADGARTFALPMADGVPLAELKDEVKATEVLDVLVADIGPLTGLDFAAYIGILDVLNVGGFRDKSLGSSGAIDYGGLHYTCYQFPYDWRRDISESAAHLADFVFEAQTAVREARGLPATEEVKVDVVAHSMGGLVLRYGAQPLPEDGSLPELNWAGAQNVQHAMIIGTPNAGSAQALEQLTEGLNLHPLFPYYRPSVLGTIPSIYQLLPRTRHWPVVDERGRNVDVFRVETWQEHGWGLANPEVDKAFQWLLPERSDEQRHQVALETVANWLIDENGEMEVLATAPGDGTVIRASTLMDERQGAEFMSGLRTPIDWDRVQFLFEDHIGLTSSKEFVDNMLFLLLER